MPRMLSWPVIWLALEAGSATYLPQMTLHADAGAFANLKNAASSLMYVLPAKDKTVKCAPLTPIVPERSLCPEKLRFIAIFCEPDDTDPTMCTLCASLTAFCIAGTTSAAVLVVLDEPPPPQPATSKPADTAIAAAAPRMNLTFIGCLRG